MAKLGFYYDNTLCTGCRNCQVACKDKNDLKVGITFRSVRDFETGKFPMPGFYHYSGTCNHCADPKCVKGCPTGAMYVAEDGTVQHDDNLCVGCKYCVWNCPYSVPQYIEEAGIVSKCNACKDLRDQGEQPVCVMTCDMRALKFGDLDELTTKYGPGLVKELPILPSASITNPSVVIKPRNAALATSYVRKEV